MSEIKVALRYAKSLLEESVKRGIEEKIKSDIDLFTRAVKSSRDLRVVLSNPIIGFDKKNEVLNKIFKGKVDDLTINFFQLVCKKGRAANLTTIAREFENQYFTYKNINKASITTAIALDDSLRNQFAKIIEEGFGKKVDLSDKVDQELIGGFILRMNDRQIDESIRQKLNQLKLNLIDQSYNSLI
ncbi:ATP synthase F1 subunit delta [Hyphobacterium sp. CCMP332]|nr:ATP synthase F1 subunit delta [Hyphobacterium sp. CCMP332]